MKQIILALLLLAGGISYAGTTPDVNEKVLKAFNQTYSAVKNANWAEYDTHYEVNFIAKEIRTRVRYDKEGNVLGTLRYYFEQDLPPHVLGNVKKKFSDKKVFGVTEVSNNSDIEYVIILEDEKNWTEVVSDSVGNMRVTKKFNKA